MSDIDNVSVEHKIGENVFKGLINIVDTLYGGLLGYAIYRTYEYINEKQYIDKIVEQRKWKIAFLIILTISMLEDYVAVRMVNVVKEYRTTLIFVFDIFIAVNFFLAIQLIVDNSPLYTFALLLIFLFSCLWSVMMFYDKTTEDYYKSYFSMTLFHSSICIVFWSVMSLLIIFFQDKQHKQLLIKESFLLCGTSVVILTLIKYQVWYQQKRNVNINPFIKHTGPILSKPLTYLLAFILSLMKIVLVILFHTFRKLAVDFLYQKIFIGILNIWKTIRKFVMLSKKRMK